MSMDMATKSSMRRLMLRWSLLLVCLLMTSLIASTMTHARERIAVTTIECSIANHANDASDKSRSEEHTSELQSLMRISYAVFCLKKKKKEKKDRRQTTMNTERTIEQCYVIKNNRIKYE